MKKLLLLPIFLLIFSCSQQPKYTKDTCFQTNLLTILQIIDVTKSHYIVNIVTILGESKKQFKHQTFELDIEKSGAIAESCDRFKE